MGTLHYQKEIPVRFEPDVLVAGGGPAGCAAAWAAAKAGAKVLLLEGHSCLGGLGTAGMVPAFMSMGDGERFLCSGFANDIMQGLYGEDFDLKTGVYAKGSMSIRAEELKRLYDEALERAGVEFFFQTQLIDATVEDGRIQEAVFTAKSGIFAVKAKMYIDCTGDGDLSVMSGASFEKGDEAGNMMAGSLCSLWSGIDWSRVIKPDSRKIERAIEDGVFAIPDRSLPGMWKISDSVGGGNIGHLFGLDATDERSLTKGLLRGRQYVKEYERYFKDYLTGYEKMELIATGSLPGIRESRRIRCIKTLDYSAFETLAVYDDEIGRYCYSVDIHPSNNSLAEHLKTNGNFKARHLKKGESYGIPYGALVPKDLQNVVVAGRCIGTDRLMHGSMRVMPGCYISGQASGAAAALCIKRGEAPEKLDVKALQRALLDLGACLPNAEV